MTESTPREALVEEMAKAMHAIYFDPKDGGYTWATTSQWNRDAYLNQARAALAVVDASEVRPRGTITPPADVREVARTFAEHIGWVWERLNPMWQEAFTQAAQKVLARPRQAVTDADDAQEALQVLIETAIRDEQKRIAALPQPMKTWTGDQFRAWSNGMSNAARIARAALGSAAGVRPHGTVTEAQVEAVADAVFAAFGVAASPRGTVTDAEVEAAAQVMFDDTSAGDFTWVQVVTEDPSCADIWRADARRVLEAAREVHP